jgi:hypothetical protein
MRTVHNSQMVFHLWANQSQPTARNGSGSVFFEGDTIYSYGRHFPVARIVQRRGERTAVLFNSSSYSVTTSAHQSHARQAARHLKPSFTVPELSRGSKNDALDNTVHTANLEHYKKQIDAAALRVRRARVNQDWLANELQGYVSEANGYAKFFGLRKRFTVPSDESVQKAIAKAKADATLARAETLKRNAAALAAAQQAIGEWQAGANVRIPWEVSDTFLRVKDDLMQTSRGAEVPLAHALRLLPLIRSGKAYKHNGHSEHVGHFQVDEVDKQGNVRVGCHFIKREEIERIAALLGM